MLEVFTLADRTLEFRPTETSVTRPKFHFSSKISTRSLTLTFRRSFSQFSLLVEVGKYSLIHLFHRFPVTVRAPGKWHPQRFAELQPHLTISGPTISEIDTGERKAWFVWLQSVFRKGSHDLLHWPLIQPATHFVMMFFAKPLPPSI